MKFNLDCVEGREFFYFFDTAALATQLELREPLLHSSHLSLASIVVLQSQNVIVNFGEQSIVVARRFKLTLVPDSSSSSTLLSDLFCILNVGSNST